MVSKRDRTISSILEMSYRIDLPMTEWLRRLGESVLNLIGGGDGLVAFGFDAARDDAPVGLDPLCLLGDAPPKLLDGSRAFHQKMSGSTYRLLFPDRRRQSISCPVTHHLKTLGLQPGAFPPLVDLLSRLGVSELWSLWAVVDGIEGLGFVQPMPSSRRDSPWPREWWEELGAHFAAGYRARRALEGASPLDAADGVFRPDGTPVRVKEPHREHLDTWRRILRAVDRARAAEFRNADGAILDIWRGIIDGRWSLFDEVDTDGKRYMILVETGAPPAGRRGRLSPRELQVCLRAARGLTNKEIAFDLGLSLSSVATHLRRGLSKLGITGRSELQKLGPVLQRGE